MGYVRFEHRVHSMENCHECQNVPVFLYRSVMSSTMIIDVVFLPPIFRYHFPHRLGGSK